MIVPAATYRPRQGDQLSGFTCAECGETFGGGADPMSDFAYTIISNDGSDTICSDCHQQLTEWTQIANAAIRKALGPEETRP
jgi:hypothetical protein